MYADLGARMAANNGYTNQHSYQLYDTTGTTEDWSYYATGGLGYTFEIGDEFHPPFPDVVDQYLGAGEYTGKGNREAYLTALASTADPAMHSVVSERPRRVRCCGCASSSRRRPTTARRSPTGWRRP